MNPKLLFVDLFCGAGGTTTGVEKARWQREKASKVIACVNHDPMAIQSHRANHKGVHHFTEDIRKLDMVHLMRTVNKQRAKYPNALLVLWASLECTNFSKAKGGQARDADSRTLADHLDRYVVAMQPDYVMIENVVEFMSWGPLDENGKPISRKNGQDWERWRAEINQHGYRNEWRELNSANYGAYTSRNRLFGCFAKEGLPIVWPHATHAKNPMKVERDLFGARPLKKWKAVKHVLDLDDDGASIFDIKPNGKPRIQSEATMKRILGGLRKYARNPFITTYYGGNYEDKTYGLERPSRVLTAQRDQMLTQAKFIMKYHGNGHNVFSSNGPAPTLDTGDRCATVTAQWMDMQFSNGQRDKSVNEPAGGLTTVPKHNLVSCFLIPGSFANGAKSVEEPAPTLLASRRHMSVARPFIINPQFGNMGNDIEQPCPTILAIQGKRPLMLATSSGITQTAPDFIKATEEGIVFEIYESDSDTVKLIKQFMAENMIGDIRMRMLKVSELLKIQGFPWGYELRGNQSDKKKFIGNSVAPIIPKKWCEAFAQYFELHPEVIMKYRLVA